MSHRPRPRGQSTVNVWHTIPVFIALVRFWWSTVLFPAHATHLTQPATAPRSRWASVATLSLVLLSAVVFFGNLAYPFIEPDESRYAQIALEMNQSGDYIVPRLNHEPYLDKPPLLYWATATSFRLFGTTELAARLPSAIAATLTVLLTFWLGSRLFGLRTAYIASILLFLSLGFVLSGRFVIMDGLLTLFTTLCLLASFVAIHAPRVRLGWWIVAAAACALGVLTKGPIAVVLTVPALVALQWLSRYTARLNWRHWLAFVGIAGALTVPWFIAVGFSQPEFLSYFLWKHHVLRFVTAFNHQEPFWYYVPVLLVGMFPCSLLTAPILAFLIGRTETLRRVRTEELGAAVLSAAWILVFFSASSCKLPTYILPAVPLLCLIVGCMVSELLKSAAPLTALDNLTHQLPLHATVAACVIGASISVIDLVLSSDRGWGQVLDYGVITAAVSFLGYRLLRRRTWSRRSANWLVAAGTSILVMVFAFQKFMPEFAGYRSIHANAARLQHAPDGKVLPLVYLDWQCDGYPFYVSSSDIHQFTEDDLEQAAQYLREHAECLFVANPESAHLLQEQLGNTATFTRSARCARPALCRLHHWAVTTTPGPASGTARTAVAPQPPHWAPGHPSLHDRHCSPQRSLPPGDAGKITSRFSDPSTGPLPTGDEETAAAISESSPRKISSICCAVTKRVTGLAISLVARQMSETRQVPLALLLVRPRWPQAFHARNRSQRSGEASHAEVLCSIWTSGVGVAGQKCTRGGHQSVSVVVRQAGHAPGQFAAGTYPAGRAVGVAAGRDDPG